MPAFWTLTFEFLFYVTMGIIWPYLRDKHISFTVAAVGTVFLILNSVPTSDIVAHQRVSLVFLFLIGISTLRYYIKQDGFAIYGATLALSALMLAFFIGPLPAAAGVISSLVIVFCDGKAWARLRFLGTISYSLYLIHEPIGGRVVNLSSRLGSGSMTF